MMLAILGIFRVERYLLSTKSRDIRATVTMRKLSLQSYGLLGLLVAILSGCSSFHNVSIVSHGNEMTEETTDSSSPPVVSDLSVPVIKPDSPFPVVSQPSEPLMPQTVTPPIGSAIAAQSADDSMLPLALEDVFFDYDQYAIRRKDVPALELNAKVLLKRYATREVLIQGHCDERGTEEYNLILGERRAMMVKNYLVDLGVPASNLRVLSLGKNEPFCHQPTLQCFQQNRRAHFVLE
jgi:peptidoglycan-associated lipoprotein